MPAELHAVRQRVLLVEDEVSGAEVLRLILAEAGYDVVVAADGRQAVDRLAEAPVQLLVTDFMMPVMNGGELVRAVREMQAYASLPVLIISGAPEAALRSYRLDYQAFLRKPFNIESFLQAVRGLVRAG